MVSDRIISTAHVNAVLLVHRQIALLPSPLTQSWRYRLRLAACFFQRAFGWQFSAARGSECPSFTGGAGIFVFFIECDDSLFQIE